MRRWPVSLLMAFLLSASCTHRAPESTGESDQIITEQEIANSQAVTAYDAVVKLRANFLTNRGRVTFNSANASPVPVIYLDGTFYGELPSLRNIPAGHVASMRLYRAWEAQQKYGNGKLGGVIEVTTKH